ncbi:MAG: TIGR00730 family Rossman fold protein [Bacteroidota bacterium]
MNICVFCGSSVGNGPIYAESARKLGSVFAQQSITLVYGGGNVGLMGVMADAVLENRGEVIGVIPEFLLKREVGHRGLTRLEIVQTMHERKKRMADLADAFMAMPGGWGTLDELAEILTWKQLGLIHQPVGLLNINHFFEPLLAQMRIMVTEGFLKPDCFEFIRIADSPEQLILQLSH